jgi:hypothetical protein
VEEEDFVVRGDEEDSGGSVSWCWRLRREGRQTRRRDAALRLVLRVWSRRTCIVSLMLVEGAPFLEELVSWTMSSKTSLCYVFRIEMLLNLCADSRYLQLLSLLGCRRYHLETNLSKKRDRDALDDMGAFILKL